MAIEHQRLNSYLSNRSQIVHVSGIYSDKQAIQCGVPQGSLLGLLLYLCYCNDMEISVTTKLILYADDSILMYADKDSMLIADRLSPATNG